jgi:hypothetical protein
MEHSNLLYAELDYSALDSHITNSELWRQADLLHKLSIILLATVQLIMIIFLFALVVTGKTTNAVVTYPSIAVFVLVLTILIVQMANIAKNKIHTRLFASKNELGLVFNTASEDQGIYFDIGHSRNYSVMLSDEYTMIGNYHYTISRGDNRQYHSITIARLSLAKALPHIVIINDNSTSLMSRNHPKIPESMIKLNIEPQAGKVFQIYTDKTDNINAGGIFAPDLLHEFIQNIADSDVEINGTYMYIYSHNVVAIPSDLEKLRPKIRSLYSSLNDNIEHYRPT